MPCVSSIDTGSCGLAISCGVYGYAVAAALSAQGYATRMVAYSDAQSEPSRTSRLCRTLYWSRLQRVNRLVRTIAIDPGGESQPGLRQILKQGKDIVYLMADQYFVVSPGQESPPYLVALRLLNQTVHPAITAVRSAKRMGAQALTAIPMKSGHRQRVLLEPMEWASAGTGTADVARPLQIYLARLEERLLEYSALWRELRRAELLSRMVISGREVSFSG